jgi:hypothetical protein
MIAVVRRRLDETACCAVKWMVAALVQVLVAAAADAQPNSITINELSGSAQSNRPFTISRTFASGEIQNFPQARVGGSAVLTQADVKTRWPDGSVRHAMVSFSASLSQGGSITVDFVNQSTGNNSGFLDKNAILNFNGGNWGGVIQTSLGSANVRTMLQNWDGTDTGINGSGVRYWLKGPVVTQVIVEDRSTTLAYDFGSTSHKSLHPIFVVTLYPGHASGVKVEYILENMWTTKLQDESFSLTLFTGNPATNNVYTKNTFTHYAKTRWRKVFWSGTSLEKTSGGSWKIKVDHNLPYLVKTKAIPNFDLTRSSNANGSGYSTAFDINESGEWLKYMPQTGGRRDIGLFPEWYLEYLYSMHPGMLSVMIGNAEVSGYVPIHLRESNPNLMFDSGKAVNAFGRHYSKDAHPLGDGIVTVGTVSGSHGWTPDTAHQASFAYIPYLITGDWYFLEEIQQWSAHDLFGSTGNSRFYQDHNDWSYVRDQTRGVAWRLRTIAHAAVGSPDGSAEKAYHTQKVLNNIAIREGMHDIRDGAFFNTARDRWDWGYFVASWYVDVANPTQHRPNPLNLVNIDEYAASGQINPAVAKYLDAPWQHNYLLIVVGHLEELGFPIAAVRREMSKPLINQLLNPGYNPWLVGAYHMPMWSAATDTWFADWASLKTGYVTNFVSLDCGGITQNLQTVTSWPQCDEGNASHGYPHIAKAAASFLPGLSDGSLTGQAAWNWINPRVNTNPELRWDIVPRSGGSGTPPSTPTGLGLKR